MTTLKHVAIIMDGNGRWANERSHRRVWGHIRGTSVVSEIIEAADALKIESLTLYAFSTENINRPGLEIKLLYKLLKKFLLKERKRVIANNIRFKVIGVTDPLPSETKELISNLESITRNNKGLKLNIAFGYGGRNELVNAFNHFKEEHPDKEIKETDIQQYLYAPDSGDVDLLIRTGGDCRISNFLLWQSAYAELYFTQTKWPEFDRFEFKSIIEECKMRERRFGSLSSKSNSEVTLQAIEKNHSVT